MAGLMSATSSRKKVPPSATLKRPGLSRVAPVKLPFTWPNSSDSRSWSSRLDPLDALEGGLRLHHRQRKRLHLRDGDRTRLGRILVDQEAAGEQRSLPLAVELDRGAHDLQPHVAGSEELRPRVELAHRLL